MDYHQDRFEDASLLIFKQNKLVALLPANKVGDKLFSHQGLTYGGFIFLPQVKFKDVFKVFRAVLEYLAKQGMVELHLKLLPDIYYTHFNFPLEYLLHTVNAKCIRTDLLSVVKPGLKHYSNSRKEGYRRALKHQLLLKEEATFNDFWNQLLIPNLNEKHKVNPVHNINEITLLKARFKHNIRQFNVYYDNKLVAGSTIFNTANVAHVQYIAANAEKNKLGSLDFLFMELLENVFNKKPYFDFGMSNEYKGNNINEGLLFWKEGFGARALPHKFYSVAPGNYKLLDSVFI